MKPTQKMPKIVREMDIIPAPFKVKEQKPQSKLTAEFASCPHHYKSWTCIKCLKETQDEVKADERAKTLKALKARGIRTFHDGWKPLCFGSYSGIEDVSCFACVFNSQTECSAFNRKKRAELKKLEGKT